MSVECAVYVAVTVTPYYCSDGPTRSTVYPASWEVHPLPEDFDKVGAGSVSLSGVLFHL